VRAQVIPIVAGGEAQRGHKRGGPKGRRAGPALLADVCDTLGDAPRRRDLLIEHLHKLQDRYGHLSTGHLAALAEEMRMAQSEVYEVASFYHHFDIVRDVRVMPAPCIGRCEQAPAAVVGQNPVPCATAEKITTAVRAGATMHEPEG
jgi:NADH:ubiquinone oxidoreductase subunit E